MKKILKHSLEALYFSLGAAGILILISSFVEDKEAFSKTLSDIGSFGSFLGGCGALIAATAAALGVNTWINQTKLAPYLSYIWDAKVILRKIYSENMRLYAMRYALRFKEGVEDKAKENIDLNAEIHRKEIELQLSKLKDKFDHIDQIITKNDFEWHNLHSPFKDSWQSIYDHLNSNPQPILDKHNLNN